MITMMDLLPLLITIWFLVCCAAHPAGYEETVTLDAANTKKIYTETSHKLSQCSDQLKKRGIQAHAQHRRATLLTTYRQQLFGMSSAIGSYDSSDLSTFGSSQITEETNCVLTPEAAIGPFWVRGEFVRSNITDGEDGIPLILDGLFIDVKTCEPIENLYWEIWSCNSAGQYSGVLEHDNSPRSNLNNTFLRGLQKTDRDGFARFETIFPGHYGGRATHIHVLAHVGATVLPNNTLTGGHIPHISQLFFEQSLIAAVEATEPYHTNKARITPNLEDGIFHSATGRGKYDPVVSYTMIGGNITDGILAFVTMGIDTSASYRAPFAAELTGDGGVPHKNNWLEFLPSYEWVMNWISDLVKRIWGVFLW